MLSKLLDLKEARYSNRSIGIDILKAIALLGVAILHSGSGQTASDGAGLLTHFSSFAVPFFLATSFYLAAGKFYTNNVSQSLRGRLSRLLIPYLSWVIIYLVFTGTKYGVSGRISQFPRILQDPVSIVFFGSPAYHLYFIPLLLIGTILFKAAEGWLRRSTSLKLLLLPTIGSILVYQIILATGNGFSLGTNVAFQSLDTNLELNLQQFPMVRVGLVALAWSFRCLPYIAMSLLLQHPELQKRLPQWNVTSTILTCLIFLITNSLGDRILPLAVYEISRGYTALIFAIALSAIVSETALIKSLGLCSFGIYLMHLIWVETLKTVLGKIFPSLLAETSVLTLLTFAIPACLISWAITAFLIRRKGVLPKLLFGT